MTGTQANVRYDSGGQAYPEWLYDVGETASLAADLGAIGDAEVADYRERGFVAVGRGLSASEVAAAVDGLLAVSAPEAGADIQYEAWAAGRIDTLTPEERLDVTRKFMGFADRDARLAAVAHHPAILAVVGRLLGGIPHMFQDMALLKPPGAGREKPWHQDNAFFHMAPGTPIVGVWIALDAATPDNGCMRVIPGSHREGPVRHARLRDLQICDRDVSVPRAVSVPLPAGGLMLFDGLLQHGTPANRTSTRRRALQFHYSLAGVPQTSDAQHRATFGWVDGSEC